MTRPAPGRTAGRRPVSSTGLPSVFPHAEDDPGHATLIRRRLARAGVANEVAHAPDGRQALGYLFRRGAFADRSASVNVRLLLDISVPFLSGCDVLRGRKADPDARTPLIMPTTDDPRDVETCYALGCGVYIAEPVQYEAIRRLGLLFEIIQEPAASVWNDRGRRCMTRRQGAGPGNGRDDREHTSLP